MTWLLLSTEMGMRHSVWEKSIEKFSVLICHEKWNKCDSVSHVEWERRKKHYK